MIRDISDKTKPCPMCGSHRIYMEEPNYDVLFCVKVQCADCGLTGYKNFSKEAKNPVEKTIEYWNTRTYENASLIEQSNVSGCKYPKGSRSYHFCVACSDKDMCKESIVINKSVD